MKTNILCCSFYVKEFLKFQQIKLHLSNFLNLSLMNYKLSKYSLLLVLLILSINNQSFAQISGETPFHRAYSATLASDYIFEGIVIRQTIYESTPGNAFTLNTIQITKVLKGFENLECGTVALISRGTSGRWVDFGNGPYESTGGSHTLSYRKDSQGIFFAKENSDYFPEPLNNPTTNSHLLLRTTFEEIGTHIKYSFDPRLIVLEDPILDSINTYAEGFLGIYFGSYEEAFQYASDNFGLDTLNFVYCEASSFEPPSSRDLQELNKLNEPKGELPSENDEGSKKKDLEKAKLYEERTKERLKNKIELGVRSAANKNITFTFANEQFTGTNPRFFEFDIMVSCNETGTYLDNAPVYITYNTSAFGSNISANNKIQVTKGSAFNTVTYENPNTITSDDSPNIVVTRLGIDFAQSSHTRTQVPTSPIQMLHVKIQIQSCGVNSNLGFTNQSTASNAMIYTTNATEPWFGDIEIYDNTTFTGNLHLVLCQPIITTFNNNLKAGIGDILTIQGKHFGATRGSGQVMFQNANDAVSPSNYIRTLDYKDYVNWTDTEIKVKIPSSVNIPDGGVAGSGQFRIVTNINDSVTTNVLNPLIIKYAVDNTSPISALGDEKLRYNLVNVADEYNYIFRCDTSISNYPIRKAIVKKAIDDWNCRTNVNWSLGEDTTLSYYGQDGINLIFFDYSLTGRPTASTEKHSRSYCPTTNYGPQAYFKEVDIRITPNWSGTTAPYLQWMYDTTGANVDAGFVDFYGVLLHEFGHAHSINHVTDTNDVMYFRTYVGPYPASFRNYQIGKWNNLVEGGIDVV
ncbi:MAG: hypothetical protein H0X63_04145, partial [Flavobacteriales bacterium]|nr:hypothetical protein [Flavobacteriales bacterium]